jgi:hypothetical protein
MLYRRQIRQAISACCCANSISSLAMSRAFAKRISTRFFARAFCWDRGTLKAVSKGVSMNKKMMTFTHLDLLTLIIAYERYDMVSWIEE